ncbi:MAG: lysylphosphatidylglycerol synthase domain-containing protein [Dongiaceae bacterium]
MTLLASERLVDTARRVIPTIAAIVLCALAAWSLYRVAQVVSFADIRAALREVPPSAILAAIGATIGSFAAFILQDYLALKRASRALSLPRAAAGSFIAQSIAHVTGFAILVGGALRARYFLACGLALTSILSVQASFSVSFGLADSLLTGLATLWRPGLASEATHLSVGWLRFIACVLILGALAVFAVATFLRRHRLALHYNLGVTPARTLALQIVCSVVDILFVAATLYLLLPAGLGVGYVQILACYLIALTLGLWSHVPAGIGVFEATILALVHPPHDQIAHVVAALLAFRAIYHILPFALGCALLAVVEFLRRLARGRQR